MEAVVLGLAWLVIAPCCLLLLFRARPVMRAASLVTLALLEVATIGFDSSAHHVRFHPAPAPAAVPVTQPVQHRCTRHLLVAGPARHHHPRRSRLALSWPAQPGTCAAVAIAAHRHGHTIELRPRRAASLPVALRIDGRRALRGYRVVDATTGRRIPLPRAAAAAAS